MKEPMCTHVHKRGSIYYYRRKTPVDLIDVFGKETVKSLGTKDKNQANVLGRQLGCEYDKLFAAERDKRLQSHIFTEAIPNHEQAKLTPHKSNEGLGIEDFDEYVARFLQKLRVIREKRVAEGNYALFEQFLTQIQQDAKDFIAYGIHPLDDNPAPLWQYEARLAAVKALKKNKVIPVRERIATAPQAIPATQYKSGALLTNIIEKWALERTPRAKSVDKIKRVIARFSEITGVSDVTHITKAHAVNFKDTLLSEGSSPANVNQYLRELSTVVNFAVHQAIIDINPAAGVRIKVTESAKSKRQPFDIASLNAIFNCPIYTNGERPAGGKAEAAYWLPLLGLYTGARLNELCQLTTEDIKQAAYHDDSGLEQSAWIISITDEGEEQEVKNIGSIRIVPLHPELIRLGFITYVQSLPRGRVFPALTPDNIYKSLSTNWSKWFNRYLREVIWVTDKRMVFHSFRHAFKDFARNSGISTEVHHAITGHSSGNVGDHYGGDTFPLRPLVEAMSKFKVQGLVLPR